MNEIVSLEKASSVEKIRNINAVQDFNPEAFVEDYTDTETGEVFKILPTIAQMAWFRLKYPDGKISVQATPSKDTFVATARVYAHYTCAPDQFLAEATASRRPLEKKPSISAREWAQTAAVGIALRNAGFGLQFSMAGAEAGDNASAELGITPPVSPPAYEVPAVPIPQPPKELSPEEKYQAALRVLCPLKKYKDKTLYDVLMLEPDAIKWLAEKYSGNEEVKAAAATILARSIENVAV